MWATSALLSATFFAIFGTAAARAEPVPLVEEPGHVTQTVVTLDAPPAEVYQVITDYAHWPAVLEDVTSVKVERGGRRDARVRFHSTALGHEVAVQFDNIPDREIRFHSVDAPRGASAHGEYLLEPIDDGRRTRMTASFYLDVSGIASLFAGNSKVRSMRRAKLAHDLVDVARWCAAQHPPA